MPETLFNEKTTAGWEPTGNTKLLIGATSGGALIFSVEPSAAAPALTEDEADGDAGLFDFPHAAPMASAATHSPTKIFLDISSKTPIEIDVFFQYTNGESRHTIPH